MTIDELIAKYIKRIKDWVVSVLTTLSDTTVAVAFDPECAVCTEEKKASECFVPFLTSITNVRMYFLLALYGILYDQLDQAGLEEVLRQAIFRRVFSLHQEFRKWKLKNCKKRKG